jgi:hypothetical protein
MQPAPIAYFSPHRLDGGARARGCWTCSGFQGELLAAHVVCQRDGGRQVIGVPMLGCAFWMRATGADDE